MHPDAASPSRTQEWVAGRRLAGHHHVRRNRPEDFGRVARFLGRQAIGLVLAGGGARGFAHIGVIRALHEAGIPIDVIGGTSSGAMCALMYALELDPDRLTIRNQRDWIAKRPWRRYAPPVLSILNYHSWDRIFEVAFAGKDIEDLWIPAFCVSSNIDVGRMEVHDTGPAWKAARASSSLPALLAPVLYDGEAHVDGGLVNNLPTDVMRARTAGPVFASSLGQRSSETIDRDAYPSPWTLTADIINPLKRVGPLHTIPKVMLQIAVLGDVAKTELRAADADVVLEPPVAGFSMTDFGRVDDIIRAGHASTADRLATLVHDDAFLALMRSAGVALGDRSSPRGAG